MPDNTDVPADVILAAAKLGRCFRELQAAEKANDVAAEAIKAAEAKHVETFAAVVTATDAQEAARNELHAAEYAAWPLPISKQMQQKSPAPVDVTKLPDPSLLPAFGAIVTEPVVIASTPTATINAGLSESVSDVVLAPSAVDSS